jgi:hypothetical protein
VEGPKGCPLASEDLELQKSAGLGYFKANRPVPTDLTTGFNKSQGQFGAQNVIRRWDQGSQRARFCRRSFDVDRLPMTGGVIVSDRLRPSGEIAGLSHRKSTTVELQETKRS